MNIREFPCVELGGGRIRKKGEGVEHLKGVRHKEWKLGGKPSLAVEREYKCQGNLEEAPCLSPCHP